MVLVFMSPLGFRDDSEGKEVESYEYDLIGVTVHTGTADGGHYYSFIRDIVNPHAYRNNKWWGRARRMQRAHMANSEQLALFH